MQKKRISRPLIGFFALIALLIVFPDTGYTVVKEELANQEQLANQEHITNPFSHPAGSEVEKPAEPAKEHGWFGNAQEELAQREYHASRNSKGLQAPNRAHNLRTYFDENGIGVEERTAKESLELLRLTYSHIGRDISVVKTESKKTEITNSGNRVELKHEGITEWFINSSKGLEHGFTIEKRPQGDGELKLSMKVSSAEAKLVGEHIIFEASTGRKLEYGALHVEDANGKVVDAAFEVPDPGIIEIIIADSGAAYPLTIDPLLTSTPDAILETDQPHAWLGLSVSGAGDVNGDGYDDVIVGAYGYDNGEEHEGAAFVYHGGPSGISTTFAAMVESDQIFAWMGYSVSGAGDVDGDGYADVIVGTPNHTNGETYEGAAFVYHGGPSGISTTAAAVVESNQYHSKLGKNVSGAGDVNNDGYADVIVGAPYYDNGETSEGAAFVYHGGPSGISTVAVAMVESNQEIAFLGTSVSDAGDVNNDGYGDVIVGAYSYDNGEINEGAAFVYHGGPSGISTTAAAMVESNQQSAAMSAGSSAGDVNGDGYGDVIVAAPHYDNGEHDEGVAFIYHGGPSGISTVAAAMVESNQISANLGTSVSGVGDVNGDGYGDVIVGAHSYDNGEINEGAAFVYYGSSIGISTVAAAMMMESNQEGAILGVSVSGAGDVNGDGYADIIVGASSYSNVETNEGAAFIYYGNVAGISATESTIVESNQVESAMGYSVSDAGDVNNDGYADVIVGAPYYDNGELEEGAAFLYHGGVFGISTVAAAMVESNQAGANFGHSVSGAGDVNNDTYADVIVGALGYTNGEVQEGTAFVYHGGPSGISTVAAAMVESNQGRAWFGVGVSDAGDVNGDGYDDVIVGASGYTSGESTEGVAFVYHGGTTGISTTAAAMVQSNQTNAYMGRGVSGAGDVNNDGYADVIVGADRYDNGELEEGAAFVYHGGPAGILTTAVAMVESNQADAWFGKSVSGAGDVNNDGYADVIVGADGYTDGELQEGAAFVYHGGISGISTVAAVMVQSNQASAHLGIGVSGAGDVNGDGYADVVAGARLYTNGELYEGGAFIYHGSPSGIITKTATIVESNLIGAFMGLSVSGAGDVNGDGYGDIIVGADGYTNGEYAEGGAFVYQGGGNQVVAQNPVPDIKANGSDGPISISQATPLSVTAALISGDLIGQNADWWVLADTAFGWYRYDVPTDSWLPGSSVTYQGPLMDLATREVLNRTGLPAGTYTLSFEVDMTMNGIKDAPIFSDSVVVTITP